MNITMRKVDDEEEAGSDDCYNGGDDQEEQEEEEMEVYGDGDSEVMMTIIMQNGELEQNLATLQTTFVCLVC